MQTKGLDIDGAADSQIRVIVANMRICRVNGVPSCVNKKLTNIIRKEGDSPGT